MYALHRPTHLTPRQTQIARLIAQGKSNPEISRATGLALDTVKKHVSSAADRLPGDSPPRNKLTLWVVRLERDDPPP